MASKNTVNLQLLEKDTSTDGNDTFNIKTMLNDNWDKIDADSKVKSDAITTKANQSDLVITNENITTNSTAIAANSGKIGTLANLVTTDKSSTVNAINETSNKISVLNTNDLLKMDIKGSIQLPTYVAGQITQLLHQIGGITVRTDTVAYTTNLITETRTLASDGSTLTYKYHTDTGNQEVI